MTIFIFRLLREMGWKGEVSDDENYAPLTEDELREFRDRSEKVSYLLFHVCYSLIQ